ncbi:Asx homology domain-containing protein [Stachybotrys elegans]|uniref:Asx homology domain-containing protein n=1 Tax=Stachybotrys elegans TaxID=80388 RepID=A0A8K0SRI0_9HYPO|nr:Asx homology domain-containing protein [Stachybotrys elegans]
MAAEPSQTRVRLVTAKLSKPKGRTGTNKKKSKWNSENILIDPKSPSQRAISELDVLSHPKAWEVLDEDEKAEILALLPEKSYITRENGQEAPNINLLRCDDGFRHDCAYYTNNILEGRHDPEWLASAWAAHERRMAGEYNDYLDRKFEENWGVSLDKRGNGTSSQTENNTQAMD